MFLFFFWLIIILSCGNIYFLHNLMQLDTFQRDDVNAVVYCRCYCSYQRIPPLILLMRMTGNYSNQVGVCVGQLLGIVEMHHKRVGYSMCTSVYPKLCHRQTVFAQTESNETLMTHDTFIEGSFHLEVFTLFESMPSSKLPHHQYVDVLFVPPVTVTSVLRI